MDIISRRISDKLYLNTSVISSCSGAKNVKRPVVNHILVIDCSGSMYSELPKIRKQLKNKLPGIVTAGDTVSIIWFSGRNQCGLLAEKVVVSNLHDLDRLNKSIDKWLQPMGLTAFVEPLQKVLSICADGGVYSLFFLTDGYDNQWSKSEIMKATEALDGLVVGAAFVEYGWYCNRPLMADMAEAIGGALVFCESFDEYEPVVERAISNINSFGKRVQAYVGDAVHELAFSVGDNGPCAYAVNGGEIVVYEDTPFHWFSMEPEGASVVPSLSSDYLRPLYQGIALLVQRMKSETVLGILSAIGEKKLFGRFVNCYGKQNLTDFQKLALEAADGKFFEEGCDPNLVVDPNAFTVLDLLFILAEDDENLFVPSRMSYKRISRATEDAAEDLTDEEQAEIAEMTAEAKDLKSLEKVQERIKEMLASHPKKLSFKEDPSDGYPVSNLVWKEDRPNVSITIRINGSVELPDDNDFVKSKVIPKNFKTFIYRNYAVIRDGIVNMDEMPVRLSRVTYEILKEEGLVDEQYVPGKVYMLDLRSLPTLNRSMASKVSARALFESHFELTKLKAAQKVYKAFSDRWNPGIKTSSSWVDSYGADGIEWLKENGITAFNGFSPKRKVKESTDSYMGVELSVAIAGISSIPSFNDVEKKILAGKNLTPRETLLKQAYDNCKDVEANCNEAERIAFIEKRTKFAIAETRRLIRKMAELKFGIIVGQIWPEDLPSLDENSLDIELDGAVFHCSLNLKDVEIKI